MTLERIGMTENLTFKNKELPEWRYYWHVIFFYISPAPSKIGNQQSSSVLRKQNMQAIHLGERYCPFFPDILCPKLKEDILTLDKNPPNHKTHSARDNWPPLNWTYKNLMSISWKLWIPKKKAIIQLIFKADSVAYVE